MKRVIIILALVGSPILFANAQVDDSFDLDLDPVLSEEIQAGGSNVTSDPSANSKSDVKQNRSIYIVNQASSGAKAGAESKAEQSDNNNSGIALRAEQLRKNRQRAEAETELKATEKIEESRLLDERKRSEILFGERFKDLDKKPEPSVTNSPVIILPPPSSHREPVYEAREDYKSKSSRSYFVGILGLSEFPKPDNIQGNGMLGIGFGIETHNNFLVEGTFQYASYKATFPVPTDIEDYAGVGAIKYQFGHGTIRPLVGGLLSYSFRNYNESYINNNRQSHSNALDSGLLAGALFEISDSFSIGAEYRYFWNLTSKTDGYYMAFYPNQEPMDTFNHYSLALTAQFYF